jgi:4a-hydroxytetrahydrobiopterin dehydratase
MRTFEFQTFEEMSMFLAEVLAYQEELQHHGKITVDHRKIIIEVYTHDVNDVTEIDKEYTGVIDNILKDVEYAIQANDDDGGYSAGY